MIKGANINSKDKYDLWTPLHCACYFGNLSLVSLFIKSGALLMATTRGMFPIGKKLIRY